MRAWVFGDNVDTDVLAPGRYMKLSIEEIAKHCLETMDPSFAASVRPGDIVVAGRNFCSTATRSTSVCRPSYASKQNGYALAIH